jgi:hypothetical protein
VFRCPQSPAVQLTRPTARTSRRNERVENLLRHLAPARCGESRSRADRQFLTTFHKNSSTDDFVAQVEKYLRAILAHRGFVTKSRSGTG